MKKNVFKVMALLFLMLGMVACSSEVTPAETIVGPVEAFKLLAKDVNYRYGTYRVGFGDTLTDEVIIYNGNTYTFNGSISGTETNLVFDLTVSSPFLGEVINLYVEATQGELKVTRSEDIPSTYTYSIDIIKINGIDVSYVLTDATFTGTCSSYT